MSVMIDNLEKLNRKERFFLIGMVLGNSKFQLGPVFRRTLGDTFMVVVPADAFVAMDYHLNWIFAAAALAFGEPAHDRVYDNRAGAVDGTQEDIDILVAFEDDAGFNHLIMLEAKGVGAFNNKQFASKTGRLASMFGQDSIKFPKLRMHLGLVSPHEPKHLCFDACPSWLQVNGKIPWLEMPISNRLVLFGCDKRGKPDQKRRFWTVKSERLTRPSAPEQPPKPVG